MEWQTHGNFNNESEEEEFVNPFHNRSSVKRPQIVGKIYS